MTIRPRAVRKAKFVITESWQSQANLMFFLALLILISFILPSLGFGTRDVTVYGNLGYSIMLLSGVAIAWGRRWIFWITAVIAVISLIARWLAWHQRTVKAEVLSDWCTIFAVGAIICVLLSQIFRPGRVTHYRIEGAVSVYLMFGAAWAHGYRIVQLMVPGSFNGPTQDFTNITGWTYFSFVTLSTVGYGDITPVGQVARTLAVGEALAGQLYLAVLIARLVAMELVFWQQRIQNGDSSD
jgi:hypothetical protein